MMPVLDKPSAAPAPCPVRDRPVGDRPAEREIYRRIWEFPEYRITSPGEGAAQHFLSIARPTPGSRCLDLGCGTGRGGVMLAALGNLNVTLIDFADNSLDGWVRDSLASQAHTLSFIEADLSLPLPVAAPYGFCCDVLEHIPPEAVDGVLNAILQACQHVYFQIATTPDVMGALVGHPLHLTVQPYAWWKRKFEERDCKILWSEDREGEAGHHLGRCGFYVSGWTDGQEIVNAGVLNESEEQIRANVRANTAVQADGSRWQQARPYEAQKTEILLVGGGPSLNSQETEIRRRIINGAKLVTLNGAYNWARERGLTPAATVVVDAREFNARFTHPVVEGCQYLVASQCHPATLEGLPKERTHLWHTTAEQVQDLLIEAYLYPEGAENDGTRDGWCCPVQGGSTVLLRAIPLLRMLGYQRFHLFGCDSCLGDDAAHHAYAQPENESETVIPVTTTGSERVFSCHPWMAAQAREFITLVRFLGDELEIEIHGDGLLAHILATGARLYDEAEAGRYRDRIASKRRPATSRAKRRRN